MIEAQWEVIVRLEAHVAELERQLGQNSGNSGRPRSRDSAAERQRQAGAGSDAGFAPRQVVEVPEVRPVVIEHAHARRCGCGAVTAAAFPGEVRAPVSYGPRVRATVASLQGRRHLPTPGPPRP